MADAERKPVGRDAVMAALVEATSALILEQGVTMSVREIAQRAGVNHGLVHTYFGSKDALVTAAFGHIVARAAAELDENGFPPADLAFRRGGEVTRALARVMLDVGGDPYPSHPILPSWRTALATERPDARRCRTRRGGHRRSNARAGLGAVRRTPLRDPRCGPRPA